MTSMPVDDVHRQQRRGVAAGEHAVGPDEHQRHSRDLVQRPPRAAGQPSGESGAEPGEQTEPEAEHAERDRHRAVGRAERQRGPRPPDAGPPVGREHGDVQRRRAPRVSRASVTCVRTRTAVLGRRSRARAGCDNTRPSSTSATSNR